MKLLWCRKSTAIAHVICVFPSHIPRACNLSPGLAESGHCWGRRGSKSPIVSDSLYCSLLQCLVPPVRQPWNGPISQAGELRRAGRWHRSLSTEPVLWFSGFFSLNWWKQTRLFVSFCFLNFIKMDSSFLKKPSVTEPNQIIGTD